MRKIFMLFALCCGLTSCIVKRQVDLEYKYINIEGMPCYVGRFVYRDSGETHSVSGPTCDWAEYNNLKKDGFVLLENPKH